MNAILVEKVKKRIIDNSELRYFLDQYRNLSNAQELLLECYLDGKIEMDSISALMPIVSNETLVRIVNLVQKGQTPKDAEAIIWLKDHGFGDVVNFKKLTDKEKPYAYQRTKTRLVKLMKTQEELGKDISTIYEFLSLPKNSDTFNVWRLPYGWCHDSNFGDETTRIITLGYRLFCQYGVEYLIDISHLSSSNLDDIIKMAEAKISPQTISAMRKTLSFLVLPNKNQPSYQETFGEKADEVIQYWVNHPYNEFYCSGTPRDLDHNDFDKFLWCVSISKEAAKYTIEAMAKNEEVWSNLMKSFSKLSNRMVKGEDVKSLFEWFFNAKPKTSVKQLPSLIDEMIIGEYLNFFIIETKSKPKKELMSSLRKNGTVKTLRQIYTNELSEDVFNAMVEFKNRSIVDSKWFKLALIVRNIIQSSRNSNAMRRFLSKEMCSLNDNQLYFADRLAKEGCRLNVSILRHILMIAQDDDIDRIDENLGKIDKTYWPELLRLEAANCKMIGSWFSDAETEFILKSKIPTNVALAAWKIAKEAREIFKNGSVIGYNPPLLGLMNPETFKGYINQEFSRLIELGVDRVELFRLSIYNGYIHVDLVNFWVKYANKETPARKLIEKTGWMNSNRGYIKWKYNKQNCDMIMKIINEHELDIPTALKALAAGIDFDVTMHLVLDGITEDKITQILIDKFSINT